MSPAAAFGVCALAKRFQPVLKRMFNRFSPAPQTLWFAIFAALDLWRRYREGLKNSKFQGLASP